MSFLLPSLPTIDFGLLNTEQFQPFITLFPDMRQVVVLESHLSFFLNTQWFDTQTISMV